MRAFSVRRIITGLVFLSGVLMMASCIMNSKYDDKKNRTVLIYIGADNNLSNIANSNIYSMNSCVSNGMDNDNLLVFVDRKDIPPVLLHVHNFKIDTVTVYSERDSTDPMVLREVVEDVVNNWESEHYGLVLWSHGTGWIPTKRLHYVAPGMNYIQSRSKAFAWEDRPGQSPKYSCMDLDGLVDAIPEGVFDYIVFDACYMGNVEVAYALRNKADYIVSSCYEIVSYGFPYHIITRDLMNGNLIKTCNEFHNYYNQKSGWERMAGISLVKTDELDSLANCFSKIIREYGDTIPNLNVTKVQRFDRFDHHVFYDLEDLIVKLDIRKDWLTEFRLQLERCIVCKFTTPYIFPGDADAIKVDSYCGLSVYIPISKYDDVGLNEDYRQTEWSRDTGY